MLANMYEGEVRGRVEVGLRYTPIPCVSELQLLDTSLQQRTTVGSFQKSQSKEFARSNVQNENEVFQY